MAQYRLPDCADLPSELQAEWSNSFMQERITLLCNNSMFCCQMCERSQGYQAQYARFTWFSTKLCMQLKPNHISIRSMSITPAGLRGSNDLGLIDKRGDCDLELCLLLNDRLFGLDRLGVFGELSSSWLAPLPLGDFNSPLCFFNNSCDCRNSPLCFLEGCCTIPWRLFSL